MKMPQHNFLLLLDLKASFAKRHVLIQYSLLLKQCNVSQKDAKSSLDDRQWAALAICNVVKFPKLTYIWMSDFQEQVS